MVSLATVSDVLLSDLATLESRRRRSLKLGVDSGLAGEELEAFADRMEESWRLQQLLRDRELTDLERAQDDSPAGLLRRIDAVIADLDAQLHPLEVVE